MMNESQRNNLYFYKTFRELANRFNLDINTVAQICRSEFKYTRQIMKSDSTKDILFNGLFKFKLKKRYETNKTKFTNSTTE